MYFRNIYEPSYHPYLARQLTWPDSFPRMSLMSLFRSSKVVSKVDLLTLESK